MTTARFPSDPLSFVRTVAGQRELVSELVRGEVVGRYRGSVLGVLWSLASPLLLLAAFTFVFGTIFQARWGTAAAGHGDYALLLFPGILLHGLLAESITRAPGLVTAVPNYVKKVVFPLELLPLVAVATAVFHALVGFAVLAGVLLLARGGLPATAVAVPLVVAPYVLLLLGVTWILASLGVYLRDIAQLTGLVSTLLMFLSPVLYPASALPEAYRGWLFLNPLTLPLEETRAALLFGRWPDWAALALYSLVALAVACAGYWWFQKSRKGFADVI
jgi:lipopolysaccharide transport system permease protein